ncbi:MAG: hypothetical protein R8P61_21885 [Bacteroidia bacterium]|nr:hypothetical protein [Bacteroidia bacterium]
MHSTTLLLGTSSLIFLENQFANIKRLIPEANKFMGNAARLEKLYKKRFAYYAEKWEILENEVFMVKGFKSFPESDRAFLKKEVLDIMEKLSRAKHLSEEAKNIQKSTKVGLLEVLLRLKRKFDHSGHPEPLGRLNVTYSFDIGRWGRKKEELKKILHKFRPDPVPRMLEALQNRWKNLPLAGKLISHLQGDYRAFKQSHEEEIQRLKGQLALFRRKKAKAKREGKTYEYEAFSVLEEMNLREIQMEEKLQKYFKSAYQKHTERIQVLLNSTA